LAIAASSWARSARSANAASPAVIAAWYAEGSVAPPRRTPPPIELAVAPQPAPRVTVASGAAASDSESAAPNSERRNERERIMETS
jgi:hypothetical protein